jgi:hypothetical protein
MRRWEKLKRILNRLSVHVVGDVSLYAMTRKAFDVNQETASEDFRCN